MRMTRVLAWAVLFSAAAAVIARATNPPAVVPAYGTKVEYDVGQAGRPSAADVKRHTELLEELVAEVREIKDAVRAGDAFAPAKKAPDMLAAARKHCAACHTPSSPDGQFVLWSADKADALKPFSIEERNRILKQVTLGTMPKGAKKLTGDDVAAFR